MMPSGLAIATGAFCFIWPLLPLLLNSRKHMNDVKLESIITHVLGQVSNFGIAEVFRTQIPLPEDLFLDKCNLSPDECLFFSKEKIALPLFRPPLYNASTPHTVSTSLSSTSSQTMVHDAQLDTQLPRGLCRGQYYNTKNNKFQDGPVIYNSLHHYPDAICMLFGSAVVSFIASICHWKNINHTKKGFTQVSLTVRSILVLTDIGMIGSFLVYLVHLYLTYDMLQLLGVLVGILLQVSINRIISYHHKSSGQKNKMAATTNLELDDYQDAEPIELKSFIGSIIKPKCTPTPVTTTFTTTTTTTSGAGKTTTLK